MANFEAGEQSVRVYDSLIYKGSKRCILTEMIGLEARNSQRSSILNEIFRGVYRDTCLCVAVLSITMYCLCNIL